MTRKDSDAVACETASPRPAPSRPGEPPEARRTIGEAGGTLKGPGLSDTSRQAPPALHRGIDVCWRTQHDRAPGENSCARRDAGGPPARALVQPSRSKFGTGPATGPSPTSTTPPKRCGPAASSASSSSTSPIPASTTRVPTTLSSRRCPRRTSTRKPRRTEAIKGLPPYLASLYEDGSLLSREQEAHLFRKMNYLKALRQPPPRPDRSGPRLLRPSG